MLQALPLSPYTGNPKQFVRIRPLSPPQIGKSMVGIVESHPFFPRGTEVSTTHVLSIEGRHAQTRSSVYELLD
jgi:hypothetical protein